MRNNKNFTISEDRVIAESYSRDIPVKLIAKKLKRSSAGIICRAKKLGIKRCKNAEDDYFELNFNPKKLNPKQLKVEPLPFDRVTAR